LKPLKQAKKFAKMFINVIGMDDAPAALAELGAVEALMSKSREFRSLLVSPVFTEEERQRALGEVAEKLKLSEKVVKFLSHITSTGVAAALSEILKSATAIYLEKKKRAKAVVMSPVAVGKDYEDRLKAALKKLIDRDVDVEYVLEPSLLGGVLVKVGSTMYDSSIRGQLRLLKDELIKG
jgi:F-type H+-transporting ATPase subunit delta